jgi:hypothetical protein
LALPVSWYPLCDHLAGSERDREGPRVLTWGSVRVAEILNFSNRTFQFSQRPMLQYCHSLPCRDFQAFSTLKLRNTSSVPTLHTLKFLTFEAISSFSFSFLQLKFVKFRTFQTVRISIMQSFSNFHSLIFRSELSIFPNLFVCPSVCLSVSLSVCPSLCMSVFVFVCLVEWASGKYLV